MNIVNEINNCLKSHYSAILCRKLKRGIYRNLSIIFSLMCSWYLGKIDQFLICILQGAIEILIQGVHNFIKVFFV